MRLATFGIATATAIVSVSELADAFTSGSLISNREYQRGKAWEVVQKQVFIDSLFRS